MTITVRPRGTNWQYDIRFRWPEGGCFRERANAPVKSKSAAVRWAQARESKLLAEGKSAYKAAPSVTLPTLAEFWPRVVSDHYEANRKKPSTIQSAKDAYRLYLSAFDTKLLNEFSNADIALLKGTLKDRAPKTVNNILSVLSRVLHCAVEWSLLPSMPCRIELLPTDDTPPKWYERHEYRRMVDSAALLSSAHLCLVLLAGSAGLRRGEIIALKWTDLDFTTRQIRVERAIWSNHEKTPKGGRHRIVDMTDELFEALKTHRHLKGERILYSAKGQVLSNRTVRNWLGTVLRRANLPSTKAAGKYERDIGAIHRLRHTFCSHLAMAGVPAKAIQELAGHKDLKTTLKYMHLAPSDRASAVAALSSYYASNEDRRTEKRSR